MKANAKKLLALILAMVMCLSLAAPAMAAGADAAADVALSTQEVKVNVASFTELTKAGGDTKNGYRINFSDTTTPIDVAWTDADTVFATVTTADYGSKLVGNKKKVLKTVTATAAYTKANDKAVTAEFVIDDPADITYNLEDASIAWATLTNEQNWYEDSSSVMWEVKGSVYQELQDNGQYKVYFKLSPLTADGLTYDTSATAKPVYLVGQKSDKTKCATDKQIRDVLKKAVANGIVDKEGKTPATADTRSFARSLGAATGAYTYTYALYDSNGATFTEGSSFGVATFTDLATTATAKVRVTYNANQYDTTTTTKAITVEKDADSVKAALTEMADAVGSIWSLTSVTADGEYMNVAVAKKAATATETSDDFFLADSNIATYTIGTLTKVGLIDLSKDGSYYATATDVTNKNKSTIKAGTKLYGPVATKASSLPEYVSSKAGKTAAADGYIYWDSEAEMEKDLQNKDCGSAKTINIVKLIVNQKNGETENTYTANDWAESKKAFTEKATVTLAKSTTHLYKKVTTTVPGTCKADGSETTEDICKLCGTKKGEAKTKTLPKDQSSVMKKAKTATPPYVYNTTATPIGAETHWIKEEKITTVLKTKEAKGSIKHEYICNYGVVHDELTWTEETDKVALEYSGRWDKISWGTQNTAYVRNPASMYGYNPMVFDTDFEVTTLPLNNSTTDKYFYRVTSLGLRPDGTYYAELNVNVDTDNIADVNVVSLDANGKKLTAPKNYKANVIVKDIKTAEKDCQDGSASIVLNVYEVKDSTVKVDPDSIADSIKDSKAVLVKSFTQDVVVPAEKSHVDANNDGKCDNCGTEINQSSPDNENTVDISKAVVKFGALTYTGKAAQPTATVTLDGVKLAKGVDYEVEEMQDVNAGTYPLIVKGKGDFSGRVVGDVTIKKAANTLKVSATTVNVKVKDVKKKAKTYALKVTKAKGKVTVKSNNKNVSWKSNKITVKKGAKKATVKLTVKAKGNANYKAGTKTVKVVIK